MAFSRFTVADAGSLTWATVGAASGDLVLVFFINDGSDDQTTPGDLTRLDTNDSTGMEGGAYYRIATGSETGDLITDEGTFGINNEEYAAHVIKIPAAEWHGTTAPEDTTARATSGTPNPPNNPPSWGSETDNIWLVAIGRDDDQGISSLGGNYTTNFATTVSSTGAGTCEVASSWRINTAASEDPPGSTTTGTDEEWKAWTVAVRPVPGLAVTAVGDGSEPDTKLSVVVTGTVFEASQGTGIVEVGSSSNHATATLVEVEVNTWGDTSINIDLHEITTTNPLLEDLTAGTVWCFVTNDSAELSAGFAFTLKAEGGTWIAAKNVDWSEDVDVNFRVRMEIKNTGGTAVTPAFKWQYNKNSAGWNDITASSSVVKTAASTFFADGDDLLEQLLGTDTFITDNNAAEESTGTFTMGTNLTTDEVIEAEINLTIVSGDVVDTDTIDLRVVESDATPFGTYTQTPTVTVSEGVAAVQPTMRRWGGVPGLRQAGIGGRSW